MAKNQENIFHFFIIVILFVLLVTETCCDHQRKLSTTIYCPHKEPLCKEPGPHGGFTNVAYTRADCDKDSLHYIFTSLGLPTLLVARTSTDTDLTINWKAFLSTNFSDVRNSVDFTHPPDYVYAVVFTKLIEYDDKHDQADLSKVSPNDTTWNIHGLQDVLWDNSSVTSDKGSHLINFTVATSNSGLGVQENGSFSLTLQIGGEKTRSTTLPHLEFTKNASQFDVRLNKMDPQFNHSRFALEVVLVTSDDDSLGHQMALQKHRSIDDEHSPGTFEMYDWTSRGDTQKDGAFVQWKPVCYVKPLYNTRSASKASSSQGLQNFTDIFNLDLKPHLVYAYFGVDLIPGHVQVNAINVSFGLIGDKFYSNTNYTGWIFSVGVGTPPNDKVSLLIILIISIGLGTPVVLLFCGGIGICVKRQKDKKNSLYVDITSAYTPIQ